MNSFMKAGGSARREYDRRLVAHKAKVRRILPLLAGALAVLVPLAWMIGDRLSPGLGGPGSLVVLATVIKGLWPDRRHVDAWASGAAGEAKLARTLDRLGPAYKVFHDRRIPGSKANIDHIVIGPTGVFVIETKNVAGKVRVERGQLVVSGRKKEFSEQAWGEAAAVQRVVGHSLADLEQDVRPLLCFTKADLPWGKAMVGGVPLLYPKGVVSMIQAGPKRLSEQQIWGIAGLMDAKLKPA